MNLVQQQGLKKFCRMLTDSTGIQFVIGVGGPATDGDTVYLPDLTSVPVAEARGFVFHEALHILHSDFDLRAEFRTRKYAAAGCNADFCGSLDNAIEDARIEALGCQVYQGGKYVLEQRLLPRKDFMKAGLFSTELSQPNITNSFCTYVCLFAKDVLMKVFLMKDVLDAGHEFLSSVLGDKLVNDTEALLEKELPLLMSTGDSCRLAIKLCNLVKDAFAQARADNLSDTPEDESSEETSENDGDENSESCDAADGDGVDDDEGDDEDSGSADGGERETTENGDKGNDGGNASDVQQNIEALLKADSYVNAASNTLEVNGVSTECGTGKPQGWTEEGSPDDWVMPGRWPLSVTPTDIVCGRTILREAMPDANALQHELSLLLAAKTPSKNGTLATSGRKPRSSVLSRLAVGNLRVMERRSLTLKDQHRYDTAVEILLDRSGSMGQTRLRAALHAALILNLAIRRMPGCTSEILLFDGMGLEWSLSADRHEIVADTTSDVIDFISSQGSGLTTEEIGRLGAVSSGCNTPIVPALRAGLSRLELRNEYRKMLVVITDGTEYRDLAAVLTRARRDHVDVFVILIDGDPKGFEGLVRDVAVIADKGEVASYRVNPLREFRLCDVPNALKTELASQLKTAVRSFALKGMFRDL